jgi:hypothetical protein
MHDFGTQGVGTSSAPFTFTVVWNGGWPATIVILSVPNEFQVTNNTCTTLSPGVTCTFDVVFTPTSAGVVSAFLDVGYADGAAVATVASELLSGTGQ